MTHDEKIKQLEEQYRFARQCARGHDWDAATKESLAAELESLRRRLYDRNVNIAVVGEFSVGKSSFINALLGFNLLATDELPDTTLFPTVMVYSAESYIRIKRREGEDVRIVASPEGIRAKLREFSVPEIDVYDYDSEEDYMKALDEARARADAMSADIEYFEIGLPSGFLEQGFRLIDTPGLSSKNERCGAVARDVMLKADASIIVAHATRGIITESAAEIFNNFIGEKLKHCIVVFTRYDQTSPSRRDRLRTHLEVSTRSHFNLNDSQMPVFMTVPPVIEAEREGRRFGEEHDEMLRLTRDALSRIAVIARERREHIIADALKNLFERIFTLLKKYLKNIREIVDRRLEELNANRSAPLEPFIEKQIKERLAALDKESALLRGELMQRLDSLGEEVKKECDSKLAAQSSVSQINNYIKNELPTQLTETEKRYVPQVEKALGAFSEEVRKQMKVFEQSIVDEFKRLQVIPVEIRWELINIARMGEKPDTFKELVAITERQDQENKNSVAGAVIGGIVGSILTLGFGTVIGALVGASLFGGGSTGSDFYKKIKPDYDKKLKEILDLTRSRFLAMYSTGAGDMRCRLSVQIKRYLQTYRSTVNERIKKEMTEIEGYKRYRDSLEREMQEIDDHTAQLTTLLGQTSA